MSDVNLKNPANYVNSDLISTDGDKATHNEIIIRTVKETTQVITINTHSKKTPSP